MHICPPSATIRQSLRALLRAPKWTAVAVLSLGLGIGANTLVFSLVDAVLLRPFPFPKAGQLVLLWGAKSERERRGLSGPDLNDIRSESHSFQGISAFIGTYTKLKLDGDDSSAVNAAYVAPGIFSVLGVQPIRGRTFLPGEDQPGREKVAVLSYGLWVGRYASNPEILGRAIRLDGEPYVVVGVMPPQFFFPDFDCQLWLPLSRSKWHNLPVRGWALVHAVGRLRAGITLARAQADVDTIARRLELAYPTADKRLSIGLFPLYRVVVGKYYAVLWTLLGAVGFVLLIACANVANLLLARAVEREKELAVRAALGANRRDIVGHLLMESVMLALLGGAAGGLIAYWGARVVRGLGLTDIPGVGTAGINFQVLAFTLTVSLLTVLVFGLGPALMASRLNLTETLARGGVTSSGAARGELRDLLVVGEVALAVVLLAGAGLLVNSFVRLARLDWGFRPEDVLMVSLRSPGWATMSASSDTEYIGQVLSRLRLLPGVQSAAEAECVPLDPGPWWPTDLAVNRRVVTRRDPSDWGGWKAARFQVGPGYFRTLGIPVIRGRDFTPQDNRAARRVVVISGALGEKLWPGEDPVGKELQLADLVWAGKGPEPQMVDSTRAKFAFRLRPPREVVGVVGNVRMFGLDAATWPALYISTTQQLRRDADIKFVIKTSVNPARLADAVRAQIVGVDRGVTVRKMESMEDLVRHSIGGRGANKLLLLVSLMFGSLGLLLAAGGIYGVVSYAVSQRTHEFGVRMALGAVQHDIIWLVMRHGSRLIVTGIALGLAGAWALTRLLANVLFGVTPTDPATFACSVLLLGAVGLFACLMPARRAARTEPAEVLRYE